MLEAKEVCAVNDAVQVVLLLEVRRVLNRKLPNPNPKGDPELEVNFGSIEICVKWIPSMELLSYETRSDASNLAESSTAAKLFPSLNGIRYAYARLPMSKKGAECIERHGNAVIRAVELWQAWCRESEAALDIHLDELSVKAVMDR